jgi:hypothetical protein
MRAVAFLLAVSGIVADTTQAQSSASFELTEHAIHAGGSPLQGAMPASATYRVTLGAIGDAVLGWNVAAPTLRIDGGFVSAFPPPREVQDLRFGADPVTLTWSAEPSAGTYALYRDVLSNLPGLGFGTCAQGAISAATATDAELPPANAGYFYLVTARNRLGEEGTKGFRSSGEERGNPAACP